MTVDHSKLPRAKSGSNVGGIRPDEPSITSRLTNVWFQNRLDTPQRPTVIDGQPWRPSKAGACAREIWYKANGFKESDPPDMVAHWSFQMGQWVHDWFDTWMPIAFPGIEIEKQYTVELPDGTPIGGNSDAFHPDLDGQRTAFELKSINGFGFKKATQGKAPEGPRTSAKIQGSLAGLGMNADRVVIINAALEVTSQGVAARAGIEHNLQRFIVEWEADRTEYEHIANAELARVGAALASYRAPRTPVSIPVMAEVQNPSTGLWWEFNDDGQKINTGNCWECNYCNFQETCSTDLASGDVLVPTSKSL